MFTFSVSTSINSYYLAALTPPIAGLVGSGAVLLWSHRRTRWARLPACSSESGVEAKHNHPVIGRSGYKPGAASLTGLDRSCSSSSTKNVRVAESLSTPRGSGLYLRLPASLRLFQPFELPSSSRCHRTNTEPCFSDLRGKFPTLQCIPRRLVAPNSESMYSSAHERMLIDSNLGDA